MSLRIVVELSIVVYAAAVLIEFALRRRFLPFALEMAAVLIAVSIALLVNNSSTGRVAFGQGTSPVYTIAIMFAAVLCGIAARYVFYLKKEQFSWLEFVKPLAISPIVLLPLMGSVQTTGELNEMQVVSFGVLAFQNGFFWQAVLGSAKPTTRISGR